MKTLESALGRLNFTHNEAAVYLYLLEHPGRTVYQIARDLSLSRSTAYPVVAKLFSDGAVLMESSAEKDSYYAETPATLLSRIRAGVDETIGYLAQELPKTAVKPERDVYATVVGYESVVARAKELLRFSTKEVYMNTDLDIGLFQNEFEALAAAKVRVIVFSFHAQRALPGVVELYSHGLPGFCDSRLMLVADGKESMLANLNGARGEWTGTVSSNALFTKVVAEHIHHDIYLTRITETQGKNPFEEHPEILLGTLAERLE